MPTHKSALWSQGRYHCMCSTVLHEGNISGDGQRGGYNAWTASVHLYPRVEIEGGPNRWVFTTNMCTCVLGMDRALVS